MALKNEVIDRVPTYPGRIKLTPVSGQANVYDLSRADEPIAEGTPINKALFDQKAYTLTGDADVYVDGAKGSDTVGDGSYTAPYATIQKAVDSIPKCLGGYTVTLNIIPLTEDRYYEEHVILEGFIGGRLIFGVQGRYLRVRKIDVIACDMVELNIFELKHTSGYSGALISVDQGSIVSINTPANLYGENGNVGGLMVSNGSTITSTWTMQFHNFSGTAVMATGGSRIAMGTMNGNSGNKSYGIRAEYGSIVSCAVNNIKPALGDYTASGGRILVGSGTMLADATSVV